MSYLTTVGDRRLVAQTCGDVVCSAGGNEDKSTNCQVDWIRASPWRRSLDADEPILHGASGRAHKGDHLLGPKRQRERERESARGGRGGGPAGSAPVSACTSHMKNIHVSTCKTNKNI